MKKRIVITGLGCLSPLGNDVKTTWNNAVLGVSGIDTLTNENLDVEKNSVKFGGEIKDFSLSSDILGLKDQMRYDRFCLIALAAIDQALKDSSLVIGKDIPKDQIGSILGVGIGGISTIENSLKMYIAKGQRRISPFTIPAMIPNMATGLASICFGFTGVNYTISSACASSCHAIAAACQEIESGRSKCMITGGSESTFANIAIGGFANMKALSRWNDKPREASRPFDKERNGFVMGEGSAILILEDLDHALERDANILAEISGFGFSSDAHHITAPHPEGKGAILAMKKSISDGGITANQIDYINAHGTSTPLGDLGETKAIREVFGKHAHNLIVSSTKSMTGHLLGAAGGLESIFCIKAIQNSIIPPTINLTTPDPECDLNYSANIATKKEVNYALNNSFGFGGTNASLIFKKYNK